MQLLPQLREPADEVLALLLQQQQTGVEALENRLHAAALLGEVADEQALLLEQRLELGELAFLLGEAVARQVDVGVRLLLALGEFVPYRLQPPEVVDGEREFEVAQLGDETGVLLGLGGLALERSKLAVDLGGDVARALEVSVHVRELAQRALLALLVLEDARRLFDERAAVLGPRVQDLVEAALADDRVRVAAQARVVQQVLDVHQPRRRVVDEVLALAAAVHAARDRDLGELERQLPSELSSTRSTSATPTACRAEEPAKMTSSIAWPRSVLADCSPRTQSTASEMLDLPEPLGPTTTVTPGSSSIALLSAKDLNPLSMSDLRCTVPLG